MDPMLYEAAMNGEFSYLPDVTSKDIVNLPSQLLPNQKGSIFMYPKLYEAAEKGDLNYLQNMTSQEILNLPFQLTPNEDTVLHIATEFHQTEFARTIVRRCESLLCQANLSGDTALHVAARADFVDIVNIFTERADVENGQYRELLRMVNLDADTALHCAARTGNYESVKVLVKADPEVCTLVNKANESPLYLSVASGCKDVPGPIIQVEQFSASYKGANGLTALHPTLYFDNYEIDKIESLVKWRKDMIREGDSTGLTPLHYAAIYGRTEAVKLFLRYDSSAIYVLDSDGNSALHLATFFRQLDTLKELINCHPDSCYLINNKGRTILHVAVLNDAKNVLKFILKTQRLARLINKQDKDGNTPLHLAALFKLYDVLEILLKNEPVDLSIENKEFLTAYDVFGKHAEIGMRAVEIDIKLADSKFHGTKLLYDLAPFNELNDREAGDSETTADNAKKEKSDLEKQNAAEVNLLVATLVATVTFAAGFTMPGGYFDNGPDQGLATLTPRAAFQFFMVFNTLAFCCSVFAVLLHFHTSLVDRRLQVRNMEKTAVFTTVAIIAMVIAFASGTCVVLSKSTPLSTTPYVVSGIFAFLYLALPYLIFLTSISSTVRRVLHSVKAMFAFHIRCYQV